MPFATAIDCADYILTAYLTAVEGQSPGSLDRHLDNIEAEIREALAQGGYAVPGDGRASATLTRIHAVMAAYRAVGEITSLVTTESGVANEFLVLQREYAQARQDLTRIREGRLDPWPEPVAVAEEAEAECAVVVSRPPMFGDDAWGKY